MAERRLSAGVVVTVDGKELGPDVMDRLSMVRVDESVQLPDAFTISVVDDHFELFDAKVFKIGSVVEIAFGSSGQMMVVTRGEVTSMAVDDTAGRHELMIEGFDVAHRLHRGPKSRTFNDSTDSDIATSIAGEYGFDTDIEGTTEVYPYVIQSNQTDYAFLYERAQRIGYELWITENVLHFKKSPRAATSPPPLKWTDNLTRFRARFTSSERCDEVTVRGWDPVGKTAVIGRATQGDLGTTAPAATELLDEAKAAFGNVIRSAGQFPVTTQSEADALARSLLLRATAGAVVARGEALGDPLIAAGATVEIGGVGRRLSGDYRITNVQHLYLNNAPYVTRFVAGAKEASGVVDLLGGANGSASASGWGSLVLATVTNTDDPDKLGRVKVKFVDLEETESHWAFLVSPGAGQERGLQLIPEVQDTVVVGFEHDDHRRPLVLGGLWSSADKPPDAAAVADGATTHRLLKSRNGHLFDMCDEDTGSITLSMGDADSKVVLTKDLTSLAGDQDISVKGGKNIKIEGSDIEIVASGKLTLKGREVELAADSQAKISGQQVQIN